jgi:hypothetical protein
MTTWLRLGDPGPHLRLASGFSKNQPQISGFPTGRRALFPIDTLPWVFCPEAASISGGTDPIGPIFCQRALIG